MSIVDVERCIWELHRNGPEPLAEFQREPNTFLSHFELTEEERHALVGRDYGELYRLGVHPMACLFYSQVNKTPMPAYLSAIGGATARVKEREDLELHGG